MAKAEAWAGALVQWLKPRPGGGPGAVAKAEAWAGALVQWLKPRPGSGPGAVAKAACLESRRSRVRTPLWPSSFKETK